MRISCASFLEIWTFANIRDTICLSEKPYKVTWYFKSVWPKEKVKDGKNILYYAFRLIFWALGMLLFLVLFAINKFKLQKYYIIENDDYIFSVKMTDETKEFFGETKFSWKIHLM